MLGMPEPFALGQVRSVNATALSTVDYTSIYRFVYSHFQHAYNQAKHSELHNQSIRVTDAVWSMYKSAKDLGVPNADAAIKAFLFRGFHQST